MSITGIQGHLLEVTVVGCQKLRDTEWISRQDPYVCLQYGNANFRTRTHTDGGRNPTFQEKFTFTLIEGLRELNLNVWNSNSITYDDFIGSGKIHLQKVLTEGYDDSSWPLQTKTGRHAGEVRLIMHYARANKLPTNYSTSAQAYLMPPSHQPQMPSYSSPSQVPSYSTPFPASTAYPTTAHTYTAPPPHASYPPNSASYPSAPYPHLHPQPSAYPPPYPSSSTYPPPPYPPPPQSSQYYPPGPYPGYPPPPY